MNFLKSFVERKHRVDLAAYVAERQSGGQTRPLIVNPLIKALDLAFNTAIGRELIECCAARHTKVTLPVFPLLFPRLTKEGNEYPRANSDSFMNTAALYPKLKEGDRAPTIIHELCHARQKKNDVEKYGRSNRDSNDVSYADVWYPHIIGEGDAETLSTMTSYELQLNGDSRPWCALQADPNTRPITLALTQKLDQGASLYSDDTKQTIFDAWMMSGRHTIYERVYLKWCAQDIHRTNAVQRFLHGCSFTSEDMFTMTLTNKDCDSHRQR